MDDGHYEAEYPISQVIPIGATSGTSTPWPTQCDDSAC